MSALQWVGLTLIAVVLSAWGVRLWAKANGQPQGAAQVRVLGAYSPVLTWLKYRHVPALNWQSLFQARLWVVLAPYAEVASLALLAAFFGRSYLTFDPFVWPDGGEFPMGIQSHYIWPLLLKCGACVAWNGFTFGGVPAFVDLHGAVLHPLVVVTTLLWGAINGAKFTVVACLALAGLAQWWLARTMRLGRVARVWAGAMGVVAGHVAGRMQIGLVPLAISVAMCSLLIAAVVDLALNRTRPAALRAAVVLALALLGGQGYLQVGLALSVLPALGLLLVTRELKLDPVWKEFLRAGLIAVLLAGVLLVPLARMLPQLDKDTDPGFETAQPLAYAPLNLVIADPEFFNTEALGKQTFPYIYTTYIGWIPVFFALAALHLVPKSQRRLLFFFLVATGLVYMAGSAVTLRFFERLVPNSAAGIRNSPIISALAVPLVLALSAWGVDRLARATWPKLSLGLTENASAAGPRVTASLAWLVLAPLLLWSVFAAYRFNRVWLAASPVHPGVQVVIQELAALVPAGQAQWVQPPWGEHFWLPASMDAGLKVAAFFRPWRWRDAAPPPAFAEGVRDAAATDWPGYQSTVDGIYFLAHPENEYAVVRTANGIVPCQATALGGNIDVRCQTDELGTLVVNEHMLGGWLATRDNAPARLIAHDWLAVEAIAGDHTYRFRYRPWDVVIGLIASLAGMVLLLRWWLRAPQPAQPESTALAPA